MKYRTFFLEVFGQHWPSLAAACAALILPTASRGAALGDDNLLVSRLDSRQLVEFTPTGSIVQIFNIPTPAGADGSLRDAVVDSKGLIHLYNGTFNPFVSTVSPVTSVTNHRTTAGFSTVNNISYGGIGSVGSYLFATDMRTFGPGDEPQGIIRFDLSTDSAVRFGESEEYQDLTIGGDGLLYALNGAGSRIHVFDPSNLTRNRTISLDITLVAAGLRGLAVDFDGSIYAAGWNGSIYALTGSGAILNSRATSVSDLTDIDINSSGRLVVGSRFGDVLLTTTSLTSQTLIHDPSGQTNHVAWTRNIPPIPEPGSAIFGLAVLSFVVGPTLGGRGRPGRRGQSSAATEAK